MVKYLIPLVLFVVLAGFLFAGLGLKPREVPSPFIGKAAPDFNLPQLMQPEKSISRDELLGKVYLLNVWASWCVTCKYEHPLLMELKNARLVEVYGLNYKDKREDARLVLRRTGDPYVVNAYDEEGRVGIDYGVTGTPETFLIDKNGTVVHKVIGALTPDILRNCILPLVEQLKMADRQNQISREAVEACV